MSYDSTITIDDDIQQYSVWKAQDVLESALELAPDRVLAALCSWLSHDQLVQFVGDKLVDDWDELRPDGWDATDDDDDEDVDDDDSSEDE